MYARLRGEEVPLPRAERRTIGHGQVLPPKLRNYPSALAILHRLFEERPCAFATKACMRADCRSPCVSRPGVERCPAFQRNPGHPATDPRPRPTLGPGGPPPPGRRCRSTSRCTGSSIRRAAPRTCLPRDRGGARTPASRG